MKLFFEDKGVVHLEMRGLSHLVLLEDANVVPAGVPFDLMVDDIFLCRERFVSLDASPSEVEEHGHKMFSFNDPSGHIVTVMSNEHEY